MAEENNPKVRRVAWIVTLRVVLVILLLVLVIAGGAVLGYVVFGNQDVSDIWHWQTWKHVFDLIFAP